MIIFKVKNKKFISFASNLYERHPPNLITKSLDHLTNNTVLLYESTLFKETIDNTKV